ncbi:MAG: hydroxysqualene dehydroxylase HpnE [Bacteroidetes bacterium]|nr:hydroxysqualene dehydroxylase HpnE [Bacteroidota bacterium]
MTHRAPDVLIIGGGLAGLAAGVQLSLSGHSILLIEQKPRLGGRTYSFIHPETGDEVDNGQHLMMGCYHSTLKYLQMIGRSELVEIQKNLSIVFRKENARPAFLRTSSLPAPLNVLTGMLTFDALTFSERLSLLRVGIQLILKDPDTDEHLRSVTVAQWLDELKQPEVNKKYLWDVIAVGALNDSTKKISAALFVKVLKSAFFGSRMNSSMVIPKKGLSPVLVDGAEEFILKHNGAVLLNMTVRTIEKKNGIIDQVILENGEIIRPKAVISAVPYFDLPKLFPKPEEIGVRSIDRFVSSPIITIHLWFDAHFMQEQFAALLDSPFHWVFNKSMIYSKTNEGLMYLALVVSGAHDLVEKEKDELTELAHNELKRFYPAAAAATVVHALIIREKRATFSPFVGLEQIRPAASTLIRNLFLAGDWTATTLPATIEGAVQSGCGAADAVQRMLKQ